MLSNARTRDPWTRNLRRRNSMIACEDIGPLKPTSHTVAQNLCGHSTTPSSASFGPLSRPPPSLQTIDRVLPRKRAKTQHCRLPRTRFSPSFFVFCLAAKLAAPSKRTFLCLCPSARPSPLVGRGSRCALLPCVSPRAGGMVVRPPELLVGNSLPVPVEHRHLERLESPSTP